jgi:sugar/nucleoside kinase (ribokinase family)
MAAEPHSPEIIGVGAATLDRLIAVEVFPGEEGVTEMLDEAVDGGGPVATALCVLAQLGRKCLLVDQVGDDAAGSTILRGLERYGVATDRVRVVAGERSAEAVIVVRRRDGARHIVYRRSTAGEPVAEGVKPEWFRRARLLHLNGRHEAAARRALALAKQAGVPVSFDGGAGRYRESLRDLVVASEVLIVAREFAADFTV